MKGKSKYRGSAGHSRMMEWLRYLAQLPEAALVYFAGKRRSAAASREMLREAVPISLPKVAVARLNEALKGVIPQDAETKGELQRKEERAWTAEERQLIQSIKQETDLRNRNNVTRTEAYRSVYFQSPELHWALLAHLVSRNGGWNMTDLKGEWLPFLLGEKQRSDIFLFLERANALIFQDAYPQLLLYQWSCRARRGLFHLLPAFGVSSYMGPVWRQFWRERQSGLLTVALIVNEQHYIEERVVRHPYYKSNVLDSFPFGIQPLAQLNGVVFPYSQCNEHGAPRLAGLILEHFDDIKERIELGKSLYAILFGIPCVFEGARGFAAAVAHSGSRMDYAPQLYQARYAPDSPGAEKLHGGKLRPGAIPIYSPSLQTAWEDWRFQSPEPGDWYCGTNNAAGYMKEMPIPESFDMTNEFGMIMDKLELAALAMPRGGDKFP